LAREGGAKQPIRLDLLPEPLLYLRPGAALQLATTTVADPYQAELHFRHQQMGEP